MMMKLIKKTPDIKVDSVKERQNYIGIERDVALLERCQALWQNWDSVRRRRSRALRFCYEDQWGDDIVVDGKVMTQREYLSRQGNVVLSSNQIVPKVNTIVGVLSKEQNVPVCNSVDRKEQQYGELMTQALQANCTKNKMILLQEACMRDLLFGGICATHETYEYRNGRLDTWTDYCNPNQLILDDNLSDPRFEDITIIGQFFDVQYGKLLEKFAKEPKDIARIKSIYANQGSIYTPTSQADVLDKQEQNRLNFYTPEDPSLCRVYEIWTLESKSRYRVHDYNEGTLEIIDASDTAALSAINATNRDRISAAKQAGWSADEVPLIEKEFFVDTFWYCRYLAVDGSILWEGESPYGSRVHPFSICAVPFVGGKIIGYLNDAIDHQIAINRALVLQDWMVRSQVKGVTMIPKQLVPKDMDYDEFAKQWTSIDGMIFYESKPGVEQPTIFHGPQISYSATDTIRLMTELMDSSSAMNGTLQGKTPYSGTSATMYSQMIANATNPIASLLTSFRTFLETVATYKLKNIAKFYDEERLQQIVGSMDTIFDGSNLNLNEIDDIEFDLVVKENTDTATFRRVANDNLLQLLQMGAVTPEEYLENADIPFADNILRKRQAQQAEMQAAQQGQVPQENIEEAARSGDIQQAQAEQQMQQAPTEQPMPQDIQQPMPQEELPPEEQPQEELPPAEEEEEIPYV